MESATTIEKAVDVLFHLHGAGPQGVTAVGRALGLPKSSVHRMLQALERRGLVERDDRGHYRPGLGLLALGLGVQDREPVAVAARPVLEARASEVGETFFLVVARGGELVVLDKVEGTGFLRAAPQVGSRVPVHATAVGKLHLAFAPEALAGWDAAEARAFTSRTRVDPEALARDVAGARARGWAMNRDEWIPGLSVLAAPVLTSVAGSSAVAGDARGRGARMHGAVALAAATARLDELGGDALAERVVATGREIGERMEGGSR